MPDLNRVKFVDAGQFDGRGVSTTIARTEIQRALDSGEKMELVLDVSRVAGDAEVEAHTVAVALDPTDLEDLLRADEGDEIGLQFDAEELEAALADAEVEAHGLRQKAAVLAVAAIGVGAFAGHAAAQPTSDTGGRTAAAAQGMTAKQIWATAPPAVRAQYAQQDAARAAKLRTPAPFQPATGGGGIEFSAPSSSEAAALVGGVALLITGAGFAARGHHRRPVKPA
jgi:hypothetical protein